jgi:hypothetical protein
VADEPDDGRPSLRVARRRDDAGGLVQEKLGERLGADPAAVHLDDVPGAYERVQLPPLAVHANPPRLDQVVGASAGGHPGPGEEGVQAHRSGLLGGAAAAVGRRRRWKGAPFAPLVKSLALP